MKAHHFALITILLLQGACTQFQSSNSSNIEIAIATYQPSSDALRIAENKAKTYWANHKSELSGSIRYLAVESTSVFDSEIPDLDSIIMTSPAVGEIDREQYLSNDDVDISCLNIFDIGTGRLVSPVGYAVLDTPPPRQIARVGPYSALYIGDSASIF